MAENEDYTISVSQDAHGRLQASSIVSGDVASVISVQECCDGVVYKLYQVLLPASTYASVAGEYVDVNATQILEQGGACSESLPDSIAALPDTDQWLSVLNYTSMITPLSNPALSSTILVPIDQAVSNTPAAVTADSVMYNMLRGAWCPAELMAAGSKNSMLGEFTARELPLRFTNDSTGTVIISGEFGSARVLNYSIGCESVILVTDAPLFLPRPAIAAPPELPTAPLRHMTCNSVSVQVTPTPAPAPSSEGSSSSTALAIGLGVGLGCAALLGIGAFVVFRVRKSRRKLSAPATGSDDNGNRSVGAAATVAAAADDDDVGGLKISSYSNAEEYWKSMNNSSHMFNTALSNASTMRSGGDTFHTAGSAPASTLFASMVSYPTAALAQSSFGSGEFHSSNIENIITHINNSGSSNNNDNNNNNNNNISSNNNANVAAVNANTTSTAQSGGTDRSKPSTSSDNQLSRLASYKTSAIDLWEIDPHDVEIALDANDKPLELGRGSFGAVYRGTLRGVQPAAIKVLSASVGSEAEGAFQREAAILKHVNRDRNVVQLYGTSKMPDGKLLLVTELMEGGDLRRALNNSETAEALAWHRCGKRVALDIARGLTALHAVRVIHRDLKSKNVLLTDDLSAKVADVGIAAVHSQGYLTASAGQVIGTLAWSAPELLLGKRCTEKVDIYSLGIVLWEIATGKMPQRGFTQPPPPSERCPDELAMLIAECTDADARVRPTAKEVYDRILEIPPLEGV